MEILKQGGVLQGILYTLQQIYAKTPAFVTQNGKKTKMITSRRVKEDALEECEGRMPTLTIIF